MIRKINIKKIFLVLTTGLVLVTNSGCYNNQKVNVVKDDLTTEDVVPTTKEEVTTSQQTTQSTIVSNEQINEIKEKNNDKEVIDYFEKANTYIENTFTEEKINKVTDKMGDYVATMIGFIWYGEEINSITYNELSTEAKQKVMELYNKADTKIETKIPNYKETIKEKYSIVSSFVKDKYNIAKDKVTNYINDNITEEEKQKYNDLKEEAKEGISNSIDDMKEVGNTYKDTINEWYQKKKSK